MQASAKNADQLMSKENQNMLSFIEKRDPEEFNPFQEIDDFVGLSNADKS